MIHPCHCWLCRLCLHFRFSLLYMDIKYQTASRWVPRLPSPIIMYSIPKQFHVFAWLQWPLIPGHPLILSLTSLNSDPFDTFNCMPKDASGLTCSNQMHFPPKLNSFSVFLFSVNDLSICTVVPQPKLPSSLTYPHGL